MKNNLMSDDSESVYTTFQSGTLATKGAQNGR